MAYITVEQLKNGVSIQEIKNADDTVTPKLEALLEYCTLLIDSYIGFSFTPELNKTVYVDGDGKNKIRLPKRIYNLINISNITTNYTYNINNMLLVDKNRSIFSRDEIFEEGDYNIAVTGDFGWAEVPDDVITCLILLCNGNFYSIDDTETAIHASGPFQSETIEGYRYELKKRFNNITGDIIETTGDTRVDQILDKYCNFGFDMEVI